MLCRTDKSARRRVRTAFHSFARSMEMATTRTVLRDQLTAKPGDLYMSFELGDKHWHISIGGDRRSVSHYIVEAGAYRGGGRLHRQGGGAVAHSEGAQLLRGRP